MRPLRQSVVVFLSTALVLVWQKTEFSQFTVQAIGFLIFIYILAAARNKWRVSVGGELGIFILNSVILLLVFQTGGISSPLFLLLFFVLFGVAIVMNPYIVFVLVLSWLILFSSFLSGGETFANLVRLGALAILSPLSYLFGKIYNKQGKVSEEVSDMKERTKDAADTISEDVEEVLEKDKDKIGTDETEKLNEILEETEDLRQESREK